MSLAKIMGLIGLSIGHVPSNQEVAVALRHARAASFQHRRLNANVQSDSLDRIEEHISNPQSDEIAAGAESLKETIRNMLGKLP